MTSNGHSTRDAPGISSSSLPKSKPLPEVPWHRKLFSTIVLSSRRLVRYWWAWEILSAAFSLAATVALVTVLAEQDGHIQEPFKLGATQVTLNTIIAAISTAIRTSLALAVAGPLNQSAWNWFSQSRHPGRPLYGRPLKDLDTFGDAAADSWSSLKLLWRTKCTYEPPYYVHKVEKCLLILRLATLHHSAPSLSSCRSLSILSRSKY